MLVKYGFKVLRQFYFKWRSFGKAREVIFEFYVKMKGYIKGLKYKVYKNHIISQRVKEVILINCFKEN